MRLRLLRPAVLVCLLLAGAPLGAAETLSELRSPAASEARLKRDVTYLASDELEGRGVTTRGVDLAAVYVAAEFKKAGLKPAAEDGSYFQPFTMAGAVLMRPAKLRLRGPEGQLVQLKAGTHFQPLGLSGSGEARGQLVFVGYGITSKEPEIDEYAGLDVVGKVVVILRGTPRADNKDATTASWRRKYGSLTEKMNNAAAHKAAAVLFVNDRDTARDGDDLLSFGYYAAGAELLRLPDLPVLHVRRSVIEEVLHEKLEDVERDIDRDLKPQSRDLAGWTAAADVSVWRAKNALRLKNVVGVLEGSGPLKDETVVIGAHYDHLGYGAFGSLSPAKKMAIHHGADDNASGTTALMELARRFGAMPHREGRRLLFVAFSAEESGLFGSEAYCKEPLFPLESTAAMINLDMVGRLAPDKGSGKDKLIVYGTGTAKTFDGLIESLNKKFDFHLKKIPTGLGPSDQMSFYARKVPVFFLFTDDHPDYHRPSDTADKINVPGMRRVVELTEELAVHLAAVPERPEYVKVAGPSMSPGMTGPRLGIRPDYGDSDEGVLVGGVSEGQPAAKAGLKEGDRITQIAGQPVKNLEGYMALMRGHKVGETIDVTVLRGSETKVFKVKLE
jgi:hypothetical protein